MNRPIQPRAHRSRGVRRGFTLVEIVVATALLAVLILGMSVTLIHSQQAEVWSREHQAASEAAFSQLDLVRSGGFAGVTTNAGNDVPAYAFHVQYRGINLAPADNAYQTLNAAPNADRVGHVKVIDRGDYDGDGAQDLYEIQVVVAWRSAKLGNQRIRVSSMITR